MSSCDGSGLSNQAATGGRLFLRRPPIFFSSSFWLRPPFSHLRFTSFPLGDACKIPRPMVSSLAVKPKHRIPKPSEPAASSRRLGGKLRPLFLRWFRRVRRDLPWRRTVDPYAILVSETMLQQTRVDVVVPYFERWMERFPSPASLASASEDEVLAMFSGLGYYRRARNLKRAAEVMVERHQGRVPQDPEELAGLPGVGEYTTGAVASIAFGLALPAVDGNVNRVVSRLLCLEDPVETAVGKRAIRGFVQGMLEHAPPGELNQALMELGATVCVPRSPRCGQCPVAGGCGAVDRREGPESFPRKKSGKKPRKAMRARVALVRTEEGVLLVHRERGRHEGVLEEMWEAPFCLLDVEAVGGGGKTRGRRRAKDSGSGANLDLGRDELIRFVEENTGASLVEEAELGWEKHAITFRDIEVQVIEGRLATPPRSQWRGRTWRWTPIEDFVTGSPTSSLTLKSVRMALKSPRPRSVARGSSKQPENQG